VPEPSLNTGGDAVQVYCTFVMAEGLQEEFLDWMECDLASNQTGGNDNGNED
jgi:hypothetical protein